MTSVKHSISVAGHKQVPWAPQMQAALFSAPGWQDGTLAQEPKYHTHETQTAQHLQPEASCSR